MSNFIKNKQVGDKGEALVYGLLIGKHGNRLQHVSQYNPKGFRSRNNCRLPDFRIVKDDCIKDPIVDRFVEVKTKAGWKGNINLDVSQVNEYLKVANEYDAKMHLYFVDTVEGCIYRMNSKTLHKPIETVSGSRGKFFVYNKEHQKLILTNVPTHIISNDMK